MPRAASAPAPASKTTPPAKDNIPKDGFVDIASFLNEELERNKESVVKGSKAVSDVAPVNTKLPSTHKSVEAMPAARAGRSALVPREDPPDSEPPAPMRQAAPALRVESVQRASSARQPAAKPVHEEPKRPSAKQAAAKPAYEEDLLSDLAPFVAAAVEVAVVDAPPVRAPMQVPIAAPMQVPIARPASDPPPPAAAGAPEPAPARPASVSGPPAHIAAAISSALEAPAPVAHTPVVTPVPSPRMSSRPPPRAHPSSRPPPPSEARRAALAAAQVSNSRSSKRLPFEVNVTIHSEHNFYAGLSLNISEGGLFVATHQLYPVGTQLEISLLLPGDDEPTTILTEVRWVRPYIEHADGSAGIGLSFIDMKPAMMARIQEFVQARSPLYHDEDF